VFFTVHSSSVTLTHKHTHTLNRLITTISNTTPFYRTLHCMLPTPLSFINISQKTLNLSFHHLAMKDRPSLSSHGAIYVPPHHRLRSVVTSAAANSPSPISVKLSQNQPPPPTTLQTPLSNNNANSRFVSAYDDVISEDCSNHQLHVPSLPVTSFKFLLLMFIYLSSLPEASTDTDTVKNRNNLKK